jgi:hypothetical protein
MHKFKALKVTLLNFNLKLSLNCFCEALGAGGVLKEKNFKEQLIPAIKKCC